MAGPLKSHTHRGIMFTAHPGRVKMAITGSINLHPRCGGGGVDGFEDEVVTIMCAEKKGRFRTAKRGQLKWLV